MSLPADIRAQLRLPLVCAPMIGISGPRLVVAACKAGIMAGLPRHNAASFEQFEQWLREIRDALDRHRHAVPAAMIGPLAVNLSTGADAAETARELDLYRRYGVGIVISARGNPSELAARVHDWGGRIFHDVTSLRFAEKAIEAQVDGITCIAAGGGGHSGQISAFALVPRIRAMFAGTILLGGAISTGAGVRAAEMLGADLAYLGTRFIATAEANAPDAYKEMLVSGDAEDVIFSTAINGVGANWLRASLGAIGLDPDRLPRSPGRGDYSHLPEAARPWRDIWSAGQGIAAIAAVESVETVVATIEREYRAACAMPAFTPA
ncbi:nitronate monooxygenase [Sphingomonas sp. TF3]|uniref:NAD(P)H-dependent flavin oxidoreductase n=1 Tax=Sphingomonas sp. TF3 TaxID=2495580 RepID=UPI000F869B2A|nr:nitronate monooxygenase [Sphingomonas sp. TF3]RUN78400.1 nitronate monooxygenase [Sphingomonas sp. TF3]